jgi:hypothetical protein
VTSGLVREISAAHAHSGVPDGLSVFGVKPYTVLERDNIPRLPPTAVSARGVAGDTGTESPSLDRIRNPDGTLRRDRYAIVRPFAAEGRGDLKPPNPISTLRALFTDINAFL